MPYLQNAACHVCNPDGVLSPVAEDSIDRMLVRLEQTRGVQAIVVAVERIKDADAYQFGMDLAQKYGIGSKKQNSGLVIVLATQDRKYYILTGEGLEGTLPDAICARVENQVMKPLLKRENWDEALMKGVNALTRYIEGDESLVPEKSGETDSLVGVLTAIFICVLVFAFTSATQPRRRCPKCGQRKMRLVRQTNVKLNGRWKRHTLWRCSACGYTHDTYDDPTDDSGRGMQSAVYPPFFGGGWSSGRSSGGGFSGGSFGGGSFGGGGAGGSF